MDPGLQDRQPDDVQFRLRRRLTEAVLLGNVAYRSGQKLEWDPVALKATNTSDADRFIHKEYRQGWEIG